MRYFNFLEDNIRYYKILYILYTILTVTVLNEIPYVSTIFSLLMVVMSFLYFCMFFFKGYYFKLSKIRYVLIVFILMQLSSFFISSYYVQDFVRLVFNTIFFFVISICTEKETKKNSIKLYFNTIINVIAPIVFVSLILYFFNISFMIGNNAYGKTDFYDVNKQFLGITVNQNTIGLLSAILIILSINALISFKNTSKTKGYLFSCIFFGVIAVALSGSRGAIVTVIVYGFFLTLLMLFKDIKKITAILLIMGSMAMIFIYKIIQSSSLEKVLTGRLYLWQTALEIIKDNPIFGVGTTAYMDVIQQNAESTMMVVEKGGLHNIFLQIATCNGIIALMALLTFIICVFVAVLIKNNKCNNRNELFRLRVSLMAIVIALCTTNLFESNLVYIMSFISVIFWITIGYLVSIINNP